MDYFFLLIIAFIFAMSASAKVKTTFAKYSKVRSQRNITGAEAAERVLRDNGITDVSIEHINGNLNDHYDPRDKTIRLSSSVYGSASVAAIGVACHEAGHAIQHARGYAPLTIRNAIIPMTQLGSNLAFPLFFLGIFMGITPLQDFGILLFTAVVFFQLITLPVEFNASSRAVGAISDAGLLTPDEIDGTKKVLSAAAMTYLAALAVALANLVRLIGMRRD